MKLILVVLLTLAVLLHQARAVRVGGKYANRWEIYKNKHGLAFQSATDEIKTYATYSKNLDYINAWNSDTTHTFTLRENQFTHLTNQQMRSEVLMPPRPVPRPPGQASSSGKQASAPLVGLTLKPLVNWTDYFGPVKNQGYCGSCYTFAAAGVVEAQYAIKYGGKISLSEEQILDCTYQDTEFSPNHGCNGGDCFYSFSYISQFGLCSEQSYPYASFYTQETPTGGFTGECKESTIRGCNPVKIKNYGMVTMGDEKVLAAYLQAYGPVTIYIDAGQDSFQSYDHGIYNDPLCSNMVTNHAVIAVGFGSFGPGQDFWIVRNSWGTTWGMNGYVLIARNQNDTCGVASSPFYAQLT